MKTIDYWFRLNNDLFLPRHALIVCLFCLLLQACASSKIGPADAYKNQPPHEIFLEGRASLKDRKLGDAIKHFEALDVQYPFDANTEQAQLYLIYAYYKKEEYALAVAAADRFIRLHPAAQHIDYAFYMRGVANFNMNLGLLEQILPVDLATRDLTQIRKAYADFNELTLRFPHSHYAASAHQYLVYLRDTMANHELQVAHFYYDRKAYLAAINRASRVVAHYQGAPAVLNALVLMAKCYHLLDMQHEEARTLTVLKYNYPDMVIHMHH